MLPPGRRTVATTKSPGLNSVTFGPVASTCPKPSWPMTRKSEPSGAAPYSAALISLSVPSTPTFSTRTSTPRPSATSETSGAGISTRCTLPGLPGVTAIAFITNPPVLRLISSGQSTLVLGPASEELRPVRFALPYIVGFILLPEPPHLHVVVEVEPAPDDLPSLRVAVRSVAAADG